MKSIKLLKLAKYLLCIISIFYVFEYKYFISAYIREYLPLSSFSLPDKQEEFYVEERPKFGTPLFIKKVIEGAFPEFKVIFTTTPVKQPHLRILSYESAARLGDLFQASSPYISFSGEPNDLPKRHYLPSGLPFLQFASHFSEKDDFIYAPFLVWSKSLSLDSLIKRETNLTSRSPSKSVAYVNSNCVVHREALFKYLREKMKEKAVALGKCSNTENARAEGYYDSLKEVYQSYNFVFAMENSYVPGYITEKILNPFEAGAIPIYWGDSETAETFFNPNAYIDVKKFKTLEEAGDYIITLASQPELIEKMRQEPVFKNGVVPDFLQINYENPSEGAKKIIDEMAAKMRRLYFSYVKNRYNVEADS